MNSEFGKDGRRGLVPGVQLRRGGAVRPLPLPNTLLLPPLALPLTVLAACGGTQLRTVQGGPIRSRDVALLTQVLQRLSQSLPTRTAKGMPLLQTPHLLALQVKNRPAH